MSCPRHVTYLQRVHGGTRTAHLDSVAIKAVAHAVVDGRELLERVLDLIGQRDEEQIRGRGRVAGVAGRGRRTARLYERALGGREAGAQLAEADQLRVDFVLELARLFAQRCITAHSF